MLGQSVMRFEIEHRITEPNLECFFLKGGTPLEDASTGWNKTRCIGLADLPETSMGMVKPSGVRSRGSAMMKGPRDKASSVACEDSEERLLVDCE